MAKMAAVKLEDNVKHRVKGTLAKMVTPPGSSPTQTERE